MTTRILVEFEVNDEVRFHEALKVAVEHDDNVIGLRTNHNPSHRSALRQFSDAMEDKLIKNDHKTSWRDLPVEALSRLMDIEIQEFQVAMQFLSVREARNELIDVANFALIVWDRLSLEDQKGKVHAERK